MNFNAKVKLVITCLIAMGAAGFVVLVLPPHGQLAYTLDSIQYLDAAHNLVHGQGLRLFNFSLFDSRYIPYTQGAPLYPLVLATGIPPEWIQAFSIAGVATLACWLLVRRARFPLPVACGLALLVTLPWPILLDASYVWSEPLTLLWLFAAVVALSRVGDSGLWHPRRDVGYWLAAVILVVVAGYTRYAAVLFVPGLMLALLRAPIPPRKRIALVMATPLTAGILLLPLLIHHLANRQLFSDGARLYTHMSLLSRVSSEFLYYGWTFAITPITQTLLVIFAISLVLATALYWRDSRQSATQIDGPGIPHAKWLGWIAGSLVFVYFFGIALLRNWKAFEWGPHILSPGMPLLLLTLAAWMQVMWKSAKLHWEKAALALPVLGMLCLSGVTSWQLWNPVYQNWRTRGAPEWPKSPVQAYSDFAPVSLPQLKGVVLCDQPEVVAFRTGWATRQLPEHYGSREMLLRIANQASGVVINSRKATQLAAALRSVVDQPRILHLGGDSVLVWKQGKDS